MNWKNSKETKVKKNEKNLIKKERKIIKKEWKNILFNCLFAFLALLITVLFFREPILATILLSLTSLLGLIKWKSKLTLAIFLFGGLWGPICEMIAINYGVWEYALPNFLNVPFWLFILWGMAAAFLFETAKELNKLGFEDK